MTETQTKIEDFVFQNGYRLRIKHCGAEGLFVALEHNTEEDAAVNIPQEDVMRLKRWLDNNFGDFFD